MVGRGVLQDTDQVFLLLADEIDQFLHEPAAFTQLLTDREHQFRHLHDLEPPFIIDANVPPLTHWPLRQESTDSVVHSGDVLHGNVGSGGRATGHARVVYDPYDPRGLAPGDILVAPQADPAWTPLFLPAAGVVVDIGSIASHAMIVARDLGIPCICGVPAATARIRDGMLLTVDGTAGTVFVH
jgi:pyruvate,water dikinase